MAIFDPYFRLIYADGSLIKLLNLDREYLDKYRLNSPALLAVHPEDRKIAAKKIRNVIKKDSPFLGVIRLITTGGAASFLIQLSSLELSGKKHYLMLFK